MNANQILSQSKQNK